MTNALPEPCQRALRAICAAHLETQLRYQSHAFRRLANPFTIAIGKWLRVPADPTTSTAETLSTSRYPKRNGRNPKPQYAQHMLAPRPSTETNTLEALQQLQWPTDRSSHTHRALAFFEQWDAQTRRASARHELEPKMRSLARIMLEAVCPATLTAAVLRAQAHEGRGSHQPQSTRRCIIRCAAVLDATKADATNMPSAEPTRSPATGALGFQPTQCHANSVPLAKPSNGHTIAAASTRRTARLINEPVLRLPPTQRHRPSLNHITTRSMTSMTRQAHGRTHVLRADTWTHGHADDASPSATRDRTPDMTATPAMLTREPLQPNQRTRATRSRKTTTSASTPTHGHTSDMPLANMACGHVHDTATKPTTCTQKAPQPSRRPKEAPGQMTQTCATQPAHGHTNGMPLANPAKHPPTHQTRQRSPNMACGHVHDTAAKPTTRTRKAPQPSRRPRAAPDQQTQACATKPAHGHTNGTPLANPAKHPPTHQTRQRSPYDQDVMDGIKHTRHCQDSDDDAPSMSSIEDNSNDDNDDITADV